MRESIGGAMLYWIVLFLFSIFIVFIAFIIKYARVYKIKNTMISYIERNNGDITEQGFEEQLKKMDYMQNGTYRICRYMPSEQGQYYYLELYSVSEFPVVGNWLAFKVTIKGETRTLDVLETTSSSWFVGKKDQCKVCTISYASSLDSPTGESSHCSDE